MNKEGDQGERKGEEVRGRSGREKGRGSKVEREGGG